MAGVKLTIEYRIIVKTRPKEKTVTLPGGGKGKILSDEKTIKKGTLEASSIEELRTMITATAHKWLCGRRGSNRTMAHDVTATSSTGEQVSI